MVVANNTTTRSVGRFLREGEMTEEELGSLMAASAAQARRRVNAWLGVNGGGGPRRAIVERFEARHKQVLKALEEGPKTVTQLSMELRLSGNTVLGTLQALINDRSVERIGSRGRITVYRLEK
jgi:predicted HTH transcriptional regulator